MRAGVWFRALPRIDRALIDLTIRVSRNIKSLRLAKSIIAVAMKLESATEGTFARAIREVGIPTALRFSLLAQNWGYKTAELWATDMSYARFLAIIKSIENVQNV